MAEPAPAPDSTRISQPGRLQLAERFGYQGDAPLSGRGLLGDTDLHGHHLFGHGDDGPRRLWGRPRGHVRSGGSLPPARRRLRPRGGCGWDAPTRSEARADLPQVGEGRPEERRAQVLDPARAARAALRADRPLDHLHVPVAPLLDALVEVDQALGDQRGIGVAVVDRDEDLLDPLVRDGRIGRERRGRAAAQVAPGTTSQTVGSAWRRLQTAARVRLPPAGRRSSRGRGCPSIDSTWRNRPTGIPRRNRADRGTRGTGAASSSRGRRPGRRAS